VHVIPADMTKQGSFPTTQMHKEHVANCGLPLPVKKGEGLPVSGGFTLPLPFLFQQISMCQLD